MFADRSKGKRERSRQVSALALPCSASPLLSIPGALVQGHLSETEQEQGEPLESWEVEDIKDLTYRAFIWEEGMSEGARMMTHHGYPPAPLPSPETCLPLML